MRREANPAQKFPRRKSVILMLLLAYNFWFDRVLCFDSCMLDRVIEGMH